MGTNLAVALEMAAAGIPVFPMRVFKDDRGKWNKKPLIKGWRTKATTDSKVIKQWATIFPKAVFAIELEKAGLVIIDCDRHSDDVDGCKAFKELVDSNGGGFQNVPLTGTSGGGWHVFLKQPKVPIRCPVKTGLPAGVEVKGAGGNIVVPGSVRPDGVVWRPITTHGRPTLPDAYCNGLAVIPPWLEKRARKVEPRERPTKPRSEPKSSRSASKKRGHAYAKAALDGRCREIAGMPASSGRNKALNAAAFSLGRMVACQWIEASKVKAALLDAAARCGLVKDDGANAVRATIASGLKAGVKQPHDDLRDKEPRHPLLRPNDQSPEPEKDPAKLEPVSGPEFDAEIRRLAALNVRQYEHQREAAAKRLDLRVGRLDKLVDAERKNSADDSKQGRPLSLPEPEPWSAPIDGAELLDGLAAIIAQHVVMCGREVDTVALWALHTYLLDATDITPRLAITSPEKGCGKTRVLEILELLVWRPLRSDNATSAAIFRTIEKAQPTLLIDEADTFVRPENDELRGILNSGHKRGGSVLRTVGKDNIEPRQFSTFAPVAIAGIGKLPDTLADRSIAIDLRRCRSDEAATIAQLRHGRTSGFSELASKARRWTNDNVERIHDIDPIMPDGVFNRVADNWRPLLAIAEAAGGNWAERARQACAAAAAVPTEQSTGVLLLGDIRAIFAEKGGDRMPSDDLVKALNAIEGHPWAEWNGKSLTKNALARLLKKYRTADGRKIEPHSIRIRNWAGKGYSQADFSDAFKRYLPE
jgi:putative DNA primase/helicase